MQQFFDRLFVELIKSIVIVAAWLCVWASGFIVGSLDSPICDDYCAEAALDGSLLVFPLTLLLSVAALFLAGRVPNSWKVRAAAFVIGGGLVAAYSGYQHGLTMT